MGTPALNNDSFENYLKNNFIERKRRNAAYSLRAMARDLNLHAYVKSVPDLIGVAKTQAASALENRESGS